MDRKLIEVLEDRRLAAGRNGRPKGYEAWGEVLGVVYTSLFRFSKGQGTLGIGALRKLAKWATANNDSEMITALAEYALDVEMP